MKYRIYYDDGSTFTGDPFYAPTTGVQVIAIEFDNDKGFALMHSKDAYYYRDGEWYGCDQAGLWDYLLQHKGPKAILLGRTMRNDAFWAIVERAGKEGI